MRDMQSSAPALAPLFRSQHQLRLLGELFLGPGDPMTLRDLADRLDMHQSTVSREVARLARHGHVVVETQGRNRLVHANRELPWYRELRSLLAQTVGPPALLTDALAEVSGIDQAFIFGSWARRFKGEPGPFPRDLDVVVVGDADADAVHRACLDVERQLHVDVNPLTVSAPEWKRPPAGSILAQVKRSTRVPIPRVGAT
jgi:DNA-binding transcriptional ArsR family regulator